MDAFTCAAWTIHGNDVPSSSLPDESWQLCREGDSGICLVLNTVSGLSCASRNKHLLLESFSTVGSGDYIRSCLKLYRFSLVV